MCHNINNNMLYFNIHAEEYEWNNRVINENIF